jgi:hypothetical protein
MRFELADAAGHCRRRHSKTFRGTREASLFDDLRKNRQGEKAIQRLSRYRQQSMSNQLLYPDCIK